MTITEFLTARYDEREAKARAATPGPWQWWNLEGEDQGWSDNGPSLETVARGPVYADGSQGASETVIGAWGHDAWGLSVEPADAAHIALNDPAYVLADIAAKRAILAMHTMDQADGGEECAQCSFHELYEGFNDVSEPWPCLTLRLLLQPFADHLDFDPTWRVS